MSESAPRPEVFQPGFNFATHVMVAAEGGYAFASDAFTPAICAALTAEAEGLPMEHGDHVSKPINAGKRNEIRQSHERFYDDLSSGTVQVAAFMAKVARRAVQPLLAIYPELADWELNEAGYQRYRDSGDMLGVHRDRRNDEYLSVTATIEGSAMMRIHEPINDPDDYANTRVVDEFRASPGSIMILRAPGLGNGEQTLHEALSPKQGSRLILNLRMRPITETGAPKILEQPPQL